MWSTGRTSSSSSARICISRWKCGSSSATCTTCLALGTFTCLSLVHLAKNTPGPKHHLEKSLEGCYGSWGALLANSLPDLLRNAKATRASAALQAAISFLQRRSLIASEKLSTWRLTQLEDRDRDMEQSLKKRPRLSEASTADSRTISPVISPSAICEIKDE